MFMVRLTRKENRERKTAGKVGFPPELELRLFHQHARMQRVDPRELCSDARRREFTKGGLAKGGFSD